MSRRLAIGTLMAAGTAFVPARGAEAGLRAPRIIDASAYGVMADGETDDAPALRRAVAALGPDTVLRLPAGTIALGSAGWAGISIERLERARIEGNSTTLRWLARPAQSTAGFGPTGLRLHECRDVVVAELRIDGNGVDCIGLGLDTCTACTIRAVEAYAHGGAGPHSSAGQFASSRGSSNCWKDCVARDATPGSRVRGFYLGNANDGWGDADLRIEGCVARRNSATGFAIEAVRMTCSGSLAEWNGGAGFTSSSAAGSPSSDHVFQGNIARSNAFHGWQTDVYGPSVERISLIGNLFGDNTFSGAFCHKGRSVSLVGNVVTGNGRDTASAGIAIETSERVTVANNTLEGDTVHGVCIGIHAPGSRVSDLIITGNLCHGAASRTLWIEATDAGSSIARVVVSGNIIRGGSHGIYLGTGARGAAVDDVVLANNIVAETSTAGFMLRDHVPGQSLRVRATGNSWNDTG